MDNDKELNEQFFNRYSELAENGAFDRMSIEIGKYGGQDFLIVDTWENLAALTAMFNGYNGKVDPFIELYYRDDLNEELDKAELQLEKELKENPNHFGTHSRLNTRIAALLNLSAYKRWLLNNEIEERSIEDFGIEVGFSDEYQICRDCYQNIVRTSPDSYSWTPPLLTDEGYVCDECASDYTDYVLEEFCNVQKSIPDQFSTKELGLTKINEDSFQNGMHYGMDDSPEPIIEKLNANDIDVWFKVYPSQFNVDFDVYVKEDDKDRSIEILSNTDTYQGFSTAGNLEKGLREASIAMSELKDEDIKYAKINSDGTASVRTVSKEEFIDGIKD